MRKKFAMYKKLVDFLNEALGSNYEVALYGAEDVERPVFASEEVTEQDAVGQDLLMDILNSRELKKKDYLCGFSSGEDEKQKKTSIFYIRDDQGEIAGLLCISEKREQMVRVKDVFTELLGVDELETSKEPSKIAAEVDGLMCEYIESVWKEHATENMSRAEKVDVIRELFNNGLFRMKGAASKVAEVTGISQASVYRYLGEVIEE